MSIIKNVIATETSQRRDVDDKRALVDKFNSGELDVLFATNFNATGVPSLAPNNVRDRHPRSTYIVQSDEDDVSPV